MSFLDELREHLERLDEDELTPQGICETLAKNWGGSAVYIPKCLGRERS